MAEAERRRRRARHPQGQPAQGQPAQGRVSGEGGSAVTGAVHDGVEPPRGRRGGDEGERGLRGLVGSGSSQVSVTAAMRARDAAQPSEQDLADAEARVVVVRRNWTPREDLPRR
ncbi:hypothetical protein [Micromonospora nigra]|uniref:hypothetical protein n=1 Tax=Micromonospora nigra TaxID=145857 RepID=UPI000B857B5C|nr:hypothetical protein [Micromonospora nigra]